MHSREERLAMNEVLFRKANDRIDQKAEEEGVIEPVAFYCECSDRDCTERIPISGSEFEMVRARPTQFLVRPGHQEPDVEFVVTETPLYLVVQKTGEAADIVTSTSKTTSQPEPRLRPGGRRPHRRRRYAASRHPFAQTRATPGITTTRFRDGDGRNDHGEMRHPAWLRVQPTFVAES
jgi:hypothetical protein